MEWINDLLQEYCKAKVIITTQERIDQLIEYYTDQGYICSLGLTCSALNYDSKTIEILRGGVDCIPGKGVK